SQPFKKRLEKVRVGVDHAWHHNAAGTVDHFYIRMGINQLSPGANSCNATLLNVYACGLENVALIVHCDQPRIGQNISHHRPPEALTRQLNVALSKDVC